MEYLKLASVVLGAQGLWRVLETLLQLGVQKKMKHAEIKNLQAQSHDVVINNLLKWFEKMEKRIKELEKENEEFHEIIITQRNRINDLEQHIKLQESQSK